MKIGYTLSRCIKVIFHPYYRMQLLSVMGFLDNPETFCEKV